MLPTKRVRGCDKNRRIWSLRHSGQLRTVALFLVYTAFVAMIATASCGTGALPEESTRTTREVLGAGTWGFLHRMGYKYAEAPTLADQQRVAALLAALEFVYPCNECASHFGTLLERSPPDVRSRDALSLWLCMAHNEVNARLEKPLFACEIEAINDRWGSCGCSESLDEGEAEAAGMEKGGEAEAVGGGEEEEAAGGSNYAAAETEAAHRSVAAAS